MVTARLSPMPSGDVFRLPDLLLDASKQRLPNLKSVEPTLRLPRLDQNDAGFDRMMRGLEDGIWWATAERGRSSPVTSPAAGIAEGKGKGRAVDVKSSELDEGVERLWEAACGSSQTRATFQPIRNWDTLGAESSRNSAGPSSTVFNSIITIDDASLAIPSLRQSPPTRITATELLQSLLRSTLGTTVTNTINWDPRIAQFVWLDDTLSVQGLSRGASRASVAEFLEIGTAVRRLEMILTDLGPRLLTSAHHAMLHAVSMYVTHVKTRLSEMDTDGGWHESLAKLKETSMVLKVLCHLLKWPLDRPKPSSLPSKASSLLSHIHAHLLSQYSPSSTPSSSLLALAFIMQSASRPFLNLVHAWVGLTPDISDDYGPSAQPWEDLGITRSKANNGGFEYTFSSRRMPTFVPKELSRKLFEGGKSLRLLREAKPEHPVCGAWDVSGGWVWGDDDDTDVQLEVQSHIRRVRRHTDGWRQSFRGGLSSASSFRIQAPVKSRKSIPAAFATFTSEQPSTFTSPTADTVDQLMALFSAPPGTKSVSRNIWTGSSMDDLTDFLSRHTDYPLLPCDTPTFPLFVSDRLLALPLAHANIVNRALVTLFLEELQYTTHLDVLSSFWLGGDAAFSERVSAALFGKEDEGVALGLGRRARTRARMGLNAAGVESDAVEAAPDGDWGIALGVGLSDRARWPPGGSELACALRTTLVDVEGGVDAIRGRCVGDGADRRGLGDDGRYAGKQVWEKVEDSVSFAIRPLPEDERGRKAKWLDPQAVEALDFLYLAYTPPATLTTVLPREILEKCQIIHAFLLRLSRAEVALRGMFQDLSVRGHDDAGKFEQRARGLRARMAHFVGVTVRYAVDIAVGANHDRMRRRIGRLRTIREVNKVHDGARDDASGMEKEPLDLHLDLDLDEGGSLDESDDEMDSNQPIFELSSVHSLVAYHHLVLNRIMRACLLSGGSGYETTSKILVKLLRLVLDAAKTTRCVARRWETRDGGEERLSEIAGQWREKEKIFMLALERLADRSSSHIGEEDAEKGDDSARDRDLDALLRDDSGSRGGIGIVGDGSGQRIGRRGGDDALKEWLLRLDINRGVDRRVRG